MTCYRLAREPEEIGRRQNEYRNLLIDLAMQKIAGSAENDENESWDVNWYWVDFIQNFPGSEKNILI